MVTVTYLQNRTGEIKNAKWTGQYPDMTAAETAMNRYLDEVIPVIASIEEDGRYVGQVKIGNGVILR